jgi:nicotinate-nucleotide--dimethylbenzimidazole phosphoribosyltransferase
MRRKIGLPHVPALKGVADSESIVGAPTANPAQACITGKLARQAETTGSLGELGPVAIRLGMMQNSLNPALRSGCCLRQTTAWRSMSRRQTQSRQPNYPAGMTGQLRFSLRPQQGLALTVVGAGVADKLPPHSRLMARKIAHGTRNVRVGAAMAIEQARGDRAGMEIADSLPGDVRVRRTRYQWRQRGVGDVDSPMRRCATCYSLARIEAGRSCQLLVIAGAPRVGTAGFRPGRVLAAFGGFEVAMMVGLMLVAASKRHLIMNSTPSGVRRSAGRLAHRVGDHLLRLCRNVATMGSTGNRTLQASRCSNGIRRAELAQPWRPLIKTRRRCHRGRRGDQVRRRRRSFSLATHDAGPERLPGRGAIVAQPAVSGGETRQSEAARPRPTQRAAAPATIRRWRASRTPRRAATLA